jgi:hypothetical protein
LDHRFLEFLGNFFLSAAHGQKQIADIFGWMQQGYSGYEDLTSMFRKFYSLETPPPSEVEGKKRDEKAFQDFQQSFNAYLRLLGVVSESEHRHLLDKLEKLEEKCEEQEKMIRNLKQLLDLKITDQNLFFQSVQDIMAGQNKIVQQMLESFWEIGSSSRSNE